MSIESYSRIDPAILSGQLIWNPGSIAAGANNAIVSLGTLPAPLVDSVFMAWGSTNYGFGSAAGSCACDILRGDTGALLSNPGGTYQTVAATTYNMGRAIRLDPLPAGLALPIQVRYSTATTNCYFSLWMPWLIVPKNVAAGG